MQDATDSSGSNPKYPHQNGFETGTLFGLSAGERMFGRCLFSGLDDFPQ